MIHQPFKRLTASRTRLAVIVFALAGLSFSFSRGETIQWFSDPAGTNQNSSGQPMDANFVFELGVFSGGFTPTAGNVADWTNYWEAAQTVNYNATSNQFSGLYPVFDNDPPFVVGALGWIMATKTTTTGIERLLMRRAAWVWPESNPFNPFPIDWRVNGDANIQVVIGTVNPAGSPFLMRSEITRDYPQWRALRLAGESLNGPGDDPDQDGLSNHLEFAFDTLPLNASSRAVTAGSFIELGGQTYLQLSIPRKRTHLATLAVQVSSDLKVWDEGAAFTEVLSDTATEWIVRDKVPLASAPDGKRFMRFKASIGP
jgi:hypothetical protein